MKVQFDGSLTSDMEKVMFIPFGTRGSKVRTIQKPLPDIGCKQSLVSLDLVKAMGLKLEDTTKQVEAINGNKINCAGWAIAMSTLNTKAISAGLDC